METNPRRYFLLWVTLCLTICWSSTAQACGCMEKPPLTKEIYDYYNVILAGKITKPDKPSHFIVEPLLTIKGDVAKELNIGFSLVKYCGGDKPEVGQIYLIYALTGDKLFRKKSRSWSSFFTGDDDHRILAGGCSGVKKLTASELDLLKLLQFKQGE